MLRFKTFLREEADSKLKHIHHAEDRPFLHGPEGFEHAVNALNQAHEHIKSGGHSAHLTMKYDGSPSIVFGRDPEKGKFFVASKSAFNKNPKINYTPADIAKNHGHAPGLMDKLHAALKHLPKVTPKHGVYQGDLMFTDEDKKEGKGGKVSFTPNTITYTAGGDNAEKIKKAKMGVVVHTQYHGNDLQKMKADPFPDHHNFGQHPDVWHQSAEHDTRNIHYSEEAQKEYQDNIDKARSNHEAGGSEMYNAIKPFSGDGGHLATYMNQTVRTGEKPSVKDFQHHIKQKYVKIIQGLKTPAVQSRRSQELNAIQQHIEDNKHHFSRALNMHRYLQRAKDVLVHTLNQHEGGLEHHIDKKRTDPEGFVVNHAGEPTKLVNRSEFARANLLKVRK